MGFLRPYWLGVREISRDWRSCAGHVLLLAIATVLLFVAVRGFYVAKERLAHEKTAVVLLSDIEPAKTEQAKRALQALAFVQSVKVRHQAELYDVVGALSDDAVYQDELRRSLPVVLELSLHAQTDVDMAKRVLGNLSVLAEVEVTESGAGANWRKIANGGTLILSFFCLTVALVIGRRVFTRRKPLLGVLSTVGASPGFSRKLVVSASSVVLILGLAMGVALVGLLARTSVGAQFPELLQGKALMLSCLAIAVAVLAQPSVGKVVCE